MKVILRLYSALCRAGYTSHCAIILQRVRAFSVADVAAEMGRTADAVAGLIRRGLLTLSRELEEIE